MLCYCFVFFKQKTAVEMLISDWSSDVCSSDLLLIRDWSSITLTDVARAAGISRQTIYNEFGSRQGLAEGYALRLADRLVNAVDAATNNNLGDRKRVVKGKSVSVSLDLGGRRYIKQTKEASRQTRSTQP